MLAYSDAQSMAECTTLFNNAVIHGMPWITCKDDAVQELAHDRKDELCACICESWNIITYTLQQQHSYAVFSYVLRFGHRVTLWPLYHHIVL